MPSHRRDWGTPPPPPYGSILTPPSVRSRPVDIVGNRYMPTKKKLTAGTCFSMKINQASEEKLRCFITQCLALSYIFYGLFGTDIPNIAMNFFSPADCGKDLSPSTPSKPVPLPPTEETLSPRPPVRPPWQTRRRPATSTPTWRPITGKLRPVSPVLFAARRGPFYSCILSA